jgi:hypothetical protein
MARRDATRERPNGRDDCEETDDHRKRTEGGGLSQETVEA